MDDNFKRPKLNWIWWIIAAVLLVAALAVVLPNFIRDRAASSANACINNLRQIDDAKYWWAYENNKTNLDTVVTWKDVAPYLRSRDRYQDQAKEEFMLKEFYCPMDKTKQCSNSYALGDLKVPPKCKIDPATHALSK
jgi:hypothetical protein